VQTHSDPAERTLGMIADDITSLLLQGRSVLPKAINNRPIRPSSDYVVNVRADMAKGRSQEIKRLLAVGLCDVRDGVPFDLVAAPYRQILAHLEVASAAECARQPERSMAVLLRRETRAQGRLDIAQLRVVETPTCHNALTTVLREADGYCATLDDFTTACMHRLAAVRADIPEVERASAIPADMTKGRRAEARTPLVLRQRATVATRTQQENTLPSDAATVGAPSFAPSTAALAAGAR
jgi:hypothetical protein